MGLVLVAPSVGVRAEPVDCDADRCAIQAAIDAECSCAEAKNHGRYTACVARVVNRAAREGTISKRCRNKINGCAIRSTCGKRDGVVLCDLPGDGVSGRCRPLVSEAQCTKRGGAVVSSCCDTCEVEPTPTATSTGPTPTATQSVSAATASPSPAVTPTAPAATATSTTEATASPEETATPEATASPAATAEPTASPAETATATTETPVATPTAPEPSPTATSEPL